MQTPQHLAATTDPELLRRARRRVKTKMGFYTHALVYVLVNAGMFLINSLSGGYTWSVWPLLGWGIGLTIHGVVTFFSLAGGDDLQTRMLASEVEKLKKAGR